MEKEDKEEALKRFLAIGTLSSGKPFWYEDDAMDIKCFINFVLEIYPYFKIDAVINVG